MTELKTGDVLLYRSNHFLSKAIQKFEHCPWSHASIVFNVEDVQLVTESAIEGTIPNTVVDSIKGCDILVLRPRFKFNSKALNSQIIPLLGKHRYDFFKLIVVQAIWQLTHKWILDESKNESLRRAICGELVAYIYYKYTEGKYFTNWYRVAPKDLFESDLFDHITYDKA